VRKILVGTAVVSVLAWGIGVAAQSSSASLMVSANVTKNCTIEASPINFGNYDPVTAQATQPLDGTGTLKVTCTKGATAHISLDQGSNGQGGTRRMRQSVTAYLNYEIYKDPGRTQVWGNGFSDDLDISAAPNRYPRTFTAYGRVPGAQDATVGNYNDIIIATVNF
jgi:spore coat protein U-like protein